MNMRDFMDKYAGMPGFEILGILQRREKQLARVLKKARRHHELELILRAANEEATRLLR